MYLKRSIISSLSSSSFSSSHSYRDNNNNRESNRRYKNGLSCFRRRHHNINNKNHFNNNKAKNNNNNNSAVANDRAATSDRKHDDIINKNKNDNDNVHVQESMKFPVSTIKEKNGWKRSSIKKKQSNNSNNNENNNWTADSFVSLGLSPQLYSKVVAAFNDRITHSKHMTPTHIQALSIPYMIHNDDNDNNSNNTNSNKSVSDIAIQSHTGSGKTLAYLLPILHHILPPSLGGIGEPFENNDNKNAKERSTKNDRSEIFAVVIVPSRDLAMQIVRDARRIIDAGNNKVNNHNIGNSLIAQGVGGANIQYQIDALKLRNNSKYKKQKKQKEKNRDINNFHNKNNNNNNDFVSPRCIVGTPGRLRELIRRGYLKTHATSILVLDEADKMLKETFLKDVLFVAKHVGKNNNSIDKNNNISDKKGHIGTNVLADEKVDYDESFSLDEKEIDDEYNGEYKYIDDDDDDDDVDANLNESNNNHDEREIRVISSGHDILPYLTSSTNDDNSDDGSEVDVNDEMHDGFDDEIFDDLDLDFEGEFDDISNNNDGSKRKNVIYSSRQVILVSATMTQQILHQFRGVVTNSNSLPVLISAQSNMDTTTAVSHANSENRTWSGLGSISSISPHVYHIYVSTVNRTHHVDLIRRAIHALDARHVIVFMNSSRPLKDTVAKLNSKGRGNSNHVNTSGKTSEKTLIKASWISGDTSKVERSNIITRFQSQLNSSGNSKHRGGDFRSVLVVNDLATHGLDFPSCDLVINLELPSDAMSYVHRAGRTGRLGTLQVL